MMDSANECKSAIRNLLEQRGGTIMFANEDWYDLDTILQEQFTCNGVWHEEDASPRLRVVCGLEASRTGFDAICYATSEDRDEAMACLAEDEDFDDSDLRTDVADYEMFEPIIDWTRCYEHLVKYLRKYEAD